MAAPQQVVIATNQPQPSVVITTAPAPAGGEIIKFYQAKLRALAITEVVFGSLCFIIGAAISGIVGSGSTSYRYRYNSYGNRYNSYGNRYENPRYDTAYAYGFTYGEGIWCGIWIMVAGALGVRAANPFASRCLINTHMAFSIVASVFSAVMFTLSVVGAIIGYGVYRWAREAHLLSLFIILCVISFVSMILLIISASYCCAALTCCCMLDGRPNTYGGGNVAYAQQAPVGGQAVVNPEQQAGIGGQQMMYAQQPGMAGQPVAYTQQPTMVYQGAPHIPQGYVVQDSQPMVQPGFEGKVVQPNQGVANQGEQNSNVPEKQGFGDFENTPPSYQTPQ